ncbi:hypothetical protein [Notoacmeibacter sp. MSK16QG-6]|uniref:DUF7282 domain-containing protein n=1 Tax=Notoacmeibacter sp. MSK16QG-6 TaxID=2957982 RepID=UPI00209D2DA0|nr:hypothetical protein [Notoacmeibacter sp. MSK16QG-6]MCP1200715.1 hypothetical protein [Notoacmeibacter sp. MSK16QG-6]
MNKIFATSLSVVALGFASAASAQSTAAVSASDQDMSGGTVMAESVTAPANGWLVVHRTEDGAKPGPVVGYAPLVAGENENVSAILQEEIASGDQLMLMVHGEDGGMKTGVFEYSLGAKEDGPVRVDDKLVMSVVTAQ